MQRVITAIILVPLTLLAVFKAPFWLYALIVAVLALLCVSEYLAIATAHDLEPLQVLSYLAVLAVLGDYYVSIIVRALPRVPPPSGWRLLAYPVLQYEVLLLLVNIAPFVILAAALRSRELRQALPSAAVSYLALPYIGISLGFLMFTRELLPDGAFAIFYLLVVVWSGDIFAYYAGRAFGKHLLSPRVSPKKTWEGAVASILGSTILGTLLLMYNAPIVDWLFQWKLLAGASILSGKPNPRANLLWMAILASACVNIAAQFGDLVESMMKRGAELKDSGNLLPGHGGVLDRIDALLLASPVLWYYASFQAIHF